MKKEIKQELELYLFCHWLEAIKDSCPAVFSISKLNELFKALYDYANELYCEPYFGDIVNQYLVTVCED